MAVDTRSRETRLRLERCWAKKLNWELLTPTLKKGCFQIGKALCIPASAVLGGLVTITGFMMSPAIVKIPGTEWTEKTLVWISVNMPTGTTKSALYQHLISIVTRTREKCKCTSHDPSWLLGDSTCEKMGELMASNDGRLLGLYDELSTFLSQLNLYKGKGVNVSHELALFLQLYNGHSWTRTTVSGDANFSMGRTSLTVGGFSQLSVARSLIEQNGSAEIGLSQRFLWLFPKPSYAKFNSLEPIDARFTDNLVEVLAKQWIPGKAKQLRAKVFTIQMASPAFSEYFDEMQEDLEALCSSSNDLLSGMLSKSKGQVLRVAAALHVLFKIKQVEDAAEAEDGAEAAADEAEEDEAEADEADEDAPHVISEQAITAAIDFVRVCCQQTAYIAGKEEIAEEIQLSKVDGTDEGDEPAEGISSAGEVSTPGFCLKLPGQVLNLTALLYAKKFRDHGYKTGALAAFRQLEEAGLGKAKMDKSDTGAINTVFAKTPIPDSLEDKKNLAKKLQPFCVSLAEYSSSFKQTPITAIPTPKGKGKLHGSTPKKRKGTGANTSSKIQPLDIITKTQ